MKKKGDTGQLQNLKVKKYQQQYINVKFHPEMNHVFNLNVNYQWNFRPVSYIYNIESLKFLSYGMSRIFIPDLF